MLDYYAARAAEYDRIYQKPERQQDLGRLRDTVRAFADGCRVLEVACGTGYWTRELASTASRVIATDAVDEVLEMARSRGLPADRVQFAVADAYRLGDANGDVDAGFAGFWLSHVPRERMREFLTGWHRRLGPGSRAMLMDNCFVEGSSTPIRRVDDVGNSYQRRILSTGAEYEVLKNFPHATELRDWIAEAGGTDVTVETLPYFWVARYRIADLPRA